MSVSAACAIGALLMRSPDLAPGPGRAELILETRAPTSVRYDSPLLGDVTHELSGAAPENILGACPALVSQLPPHVRLATDEDRRKASMHVPIPGGPPLESPFVFTLNTPVVDPSGHQATVLVTYDCSGLCGGGVAFRFRRTATGWVSYGQPRTLWVS